MDMAVRTLRTIIDCSTDDQVFKAFFSAESPLQGSFARFLVSEYTEWLVKQPDTNVNIVTNLWSSTLKPSLLRLPYDEDDTAHKRVRSHDDQVEVEIDMDYDAIPTISRRSESLELPDIPTDSETKSASPPATTTQTPIKSSSFDGEGTLSTPVKTLHLSPSPAKGKGNLALNLEDISDGTIDRIIDYTLSSDGDITPNEEEAKNAELPKPKLIDNMSEESMFLDALLSTEVQLDNERDRQLREMQALDENQLFLLSDNSPDLVDVMFTASPSEIQSRLIQKLTLGQVRFNMSSTSKIEQEAIDKKSMMLVDILEFFCKSIGDEVNSNAETSRRSKDKKRGKNDGAVQWYSTEVLLACLDMIEFHIFRPLPTALHGAELSNEAPGAMSGNDDESDAYEDSEWIHLETVYKILLFLVSANTQIDKKHLGRVLKDRFIEKFMELFLTEDRRERECLKTILHRIYGRFMGIRKLIRVVISYHCFEVVYGLRRNWFGICEFLQILTSVIHGYAAPVKAEHKNFLRNVLLPLHKCRELVRFHEELGACMYQFVFKEPNVAPVIFGALLKFWPNGATLKQEILLTEMKNIIAIMVANSSRFDWKAHAKILEEVVTHLTNCMQSEHHMVAQRAISLWADDALQAFCERDRRAIWGKVAKALVANGQHWNDDVRLATDELVQYMAAKDPGEWQDVFNEAKEELEEQESIRGSAKEFAVQVTTKEKQRAVMWSKLRNYAATNASSRSPRRATRSRSRGSRGSRGATSPQRQRRSRSRTKDTRPNNRRQHSNEMGRNSKTTKRQNSNSLVRADSGTRSSGSSTPAATPPRNAKKATTSPPKRSRRGIGFGRRKNASPEESKKRGLWR